MSSSPDFQIITSLRYDSMLLRVEKNTLLSGQDGTPSPFYMLRYHRDRLLAAATFFGWGAVESQLRHADGLSRFARELAHQLNQRQVSGDAVGPSKVRVCYSQDGSLRIDIMPIQPVSLDALFPSSLPRPESLTALATPPTVCVEVSVDPALTEPSAFTRFKTTHRDMYTAARSRAGIHSFQDPAEVILVNLKGQVMEGSLTTVYFFRGGRWVTPPPSSGGQAGTTRRWLLEQRLCHEEVILADGIANGEYCGLSNGVRGLFWGQVIYPPFEER